MKLQVMLVIVTVLACSDGLIEKYLKTCDRNSVDVNDCLTDAVQEGLVVLAEGIDEMGIPAVDPYHQKELRVEYKNNQILAKFVGKNIYVEGLKTSTVRDASGAGHLSAAPPYLPATPPDLPAAPHVYQQRRQ